MQRYYFANKGPSGQGYGLSSGHVRMWELDCEENWALKNWCFWTVVLEKTLESPLDCKEIQPVHPKRNESWVFIGRTDAEAETPILCPPHVKSWLIGKRLWCWAGLGAGREGDDRGWDGWLASPTRWTWVWVDSGSWWWTGSPGVQRFMGWQRAGHDWVDWTELNTNLPKIKLKYEKLKSVSLAIRNKTRMPTILPLFNIFNSISYCSEVKESALERPKQSYNHLHILLITLHWKSKIICNKL